MGERTNARTLAPRPFGRSFRLRAMGALSQVKVLNMPR